MPFDLWWVSGFVQVAQLWQCGAWLMIDAGPRLFLSDLLNPSIVRLISPNTATPRVLRSSPIQSLTDWPLSSQERAKRCGHQSQSPLEKQHLFWMPERMHVVWKISRWRVYFQVLTCGKRINSLHLISLSAD